MNERWQSVVFLRRDGQACFFFFARWVWCKCVLERVGFVERFALLPSPVRWLGSFELFPNRAALVAAPPPPSWGSAGQRLQPLTSMDAHPRCCRGHGRWRRPPRCPARWGRWQRQADRLGIRRHVTALPPPPPPPSVATTDVHLVKAQATFGGGQQWDASCSSLHFE